ncbi:MAG: PAS domain S-box protein [Chitinispirillaceae bacterium]
MISFYTFLSLISTFVCLHLSAYVYFRDKRSRQNKLFSLLCLSLAYLCFIEFMFRQSETPERALFWLRLQTVWTFSLAFLVHFVLVYTKVLSSNVRRILALVYLPALIFSVLNTLFYSISVKTTNAGWSYDIADSVIRDVQSFYIALTGIVCLILLSRYHLRCSDMRTRRQNLFILFALPLPILLQTINSYLVPLFSAEVPKFNYTSFAVMAAIIGYAVRRHDLFSVSTAMAADTIIDTMSEGLLVVNMDLQIEIYNPSLKRILHKSSADLKGRHISAVFKEMKDQHNLHELIQQGLPSGIVSLQRNKKVSLQANVSGSLLRDMAGNIRGAVLVIRDVSDQENARKELLKAHQELESRVEERTAELNALNNLLRREIQEKSKAEESVRSERERLHVTLRSIRDGVIATDKDGKVVLINETACNLVGESSENAIGKNVNDIYKVYEIIQGTETVHDPISSCTTEHGPSPLRNFYMRNEDDSQIIITETSAPIIDSSGERSGTVIVFRDITHHRRIEEEHFKARKLESVSVMANGIAEEFSGLLSSIVTNIFMARMGIEHGSESNKLLTSAETAAFRANSMIKQLLTFSRNNTQSVKERASIGELITDSVGFYMQDLQSDYQLLISEELWDVDIDKGQIDEVLNNIIVNADEAMPHGGTISIEVLNEKIKDDPSGSLENGLYVCVKISDTGEGIEKTDLLRIFDPYYTTRDKKMGLGLTAAYAIVNQHGGKIVADSRKGKGSTFSIYLPALPPEAEESAKEDENNLVTS